jgi:hypothetical protein
MATSRTTFQKGQSGNPGGKPPGARHHASRVLDELMDGEAEAITRAAIDEAKAGNPVALRLCLDRIMPARKDRTIAFALPPIETSADLPRATGALIAAVAEGELTPSEAAEFGKLIDSHVRAIEATDVQERLARLEAQKGIGEPLAETRPRTGTDAQDSLAYQRGVKAGLELARAAKKGDGSVAALSDRLLAP